MIRVLISHTSKGAALLKILFHGTLKEAVMAGLVNEVCKTNGPVDRSLLFSLIVGIITLFANSVEVWYLRKMEVGGIVHNLHVLDFIAVICKKNLNTHILGDSIICSFINTITRKKDIYIILSADCRNRRQHPLRI